MQVADGSAARPDLANVSSSTKARYHHWERASLTTILRDGKRGTCIRRHRFRRACLWRQTATGAAPRGMECWKIRAVAADGSHSGNSCKAGARRSQSRGRRPVFRRAQLWRWRRFVCVDSARPWEMWRTLELATLCFVLAGCWMLMILIRRVVHPVCLAPCRGGYSQVVWGVVSRAEVVEKHCFF